MAFVEIGVGAVWMVLGATMMWSGLFDKSVVPAGFWRVLRVPGAVIGAGLWVVRFGLRTGLGLRPRKPKTSH